MQNAKAIPDWVPNTVRPSGSKGFSIDRQGEASPGTEWMSERVDAELDALSDVVYFKKDVHGRYTHANLTLVRRLGRSRRDEVVGQLDQDLQADKADNAHVKQDERVLLGETIEEELQVQLLPNHPQSWCLTHKRPLVLRGQVTGMVGISRDIAHPDASEAHPDRLHLVLDCLRTRYSESVRIHELAGLSGLPMKQLEQRFRAVYQLSPQQMLIRLRIESSMRLLRGNDSLAVIGHACGFADQSAFARQFKATVGMTPRTFRSMARTANWCGGYLQ